MGNNYSKPTAADAVATRKYVFDFIQDQPGWDNYIHSSCVSPNQKYIANPRINQDKYICKF